MCLSKTSMTRVLGIDPGLGRVGFGVVDWLNDPTIHVECEWQNPQWGLIVTDKDKPDPERLQELYTDIHALIATVQPSIMAIEKLFFFRNITTALPVSQARGVILLAAAQYGLSVFEYTPMQVKQTITGYGKAEKREVQ